jgi:oligoendopeptidase F
MMGIIYLAQPIGNRVRSIDRLKPKDRKKPANCNNSNVKFGKHLSNYSDLKDRYERLVGDVDVKVIVNIPDNQIQKFEKRLKEVFVQHIKQFQEESKTVTREWMSGISIDEAKQTILSEFEKHKNSYQDER